VHAGQASLKAQFKRADVSGAQLGVILGADELRLQCASVKFLRTQASDGAAQQQVPLAQLAQWVQALNLKG
jgi:histidyl-tRNA synthetase